MALFQKFCVLGGWILWLLLAGSCKKDEKDCPPASNDVDGRDQFAGQYNVFDTNGVFQYAMEIMKANDPGKDSLFVVNWGGRFDLYIQHHDGDLTNGLNLIPPFPSYDHEGNRWAFFADNDAVFNSNKLVNDTLRLSYLIDNIAFYFEDGFPYFSGSFREYGVKQ
jgi:hypothetical protein